MFDQNFDELLTRAHTVESDKWLSRGTNGSNDIASAVLSLTRADDIQFFHFDAGHRRETAQAFQGPSAFPKLDLKRASLREEIKRLLQDQQNARPFWISGTDNILCLPVNEHEGEPACLALSYPSDLADEERIEAENRAAMIAPLIRSHLAMSDRLAAVQSKFDGAMGFLDSSHVCILLFNNQGRMMLGNEAARALLDAQDGFRMGNWAPVPVSLKDASRFQLALEHQIAQNASGRKAQRKATVFLIHRQDGRRPFVATLVPMTAAAAKPGDPAVMLYLFDPAVDHLDHLDAICELYGLSRVEGRLAHHIASGKTIDEAAVAMRIKAPTARTYLKHIFMKTGTRRQIDLVRLLMLSTGRLVSQTLPEALH